MFRLLALPIRWTKFARFSEFQWTGLPALARHHPCTALCLVFLRVDRAAACIGAPPRLHCIVLGYSKSGRLLPALARHHACTALCLVVYKAAACIGAPSRLHCIVLGYLQGCCLHWRAITPALHCARLFNQWTGLLPALARLHACTALCLVIRRVGRAACLGTPPPLHCIVLVI